MSEEKREQLKKLARRVPDRFIKQKGQFDYVGHDVVTQVLLAVHGPFDFDLCSEVRDHDTGMVTGCVSALTLTIDGECRTVKEVGSVERPASKKTDGDRLKEAQSDALKRCAMRFGLGLHLWAQELYFLDKLLAAEEEASDDEAK